MTCIGFKIYYGDGSVFSSPADGDWNGAPLDNVQVVIQFYEERSKGGVRYRDLYHANDYYYQGGATMHLHVAQSYGRVLIGKALPDDEYAQIYSRALKDMDL